MASRIVLLEVQLDRQLNPDVLDGTKGIFKTQPSIHNVTHERFDI